MFFLLFCVALTVRHAVQSARLRRVCLNSTRTWMHIQTQKHRNIRRLALSGVLFVTVGDFYCIGFNGCNFSRSKFFVLQTVVQGQASFGAGRRDQGLTKWSRELTHVKLVAKKAENL